MFVDVRQVVHDSPTLAVSDQNVRPVFLLCSLENLVITDFLSR